MSDVVTVGGIEMTEREYKALDIIIHFVELPPYKQPPTHKELLKSLNEKGENLISTEQTMRLAYSLRKKGLLVEMPKDEEAVRRSRNLIPTPKALKIMKAHKPIKTKA